MKFLKQGLSLALLGAGLAAVPGLQTAAVGETAAAAAPSIAQLRGAADGRVTITKDPATGRIAFVRVSRGGDLLPRLGGSSAAGAIAKADAFVTTNAAALGAGPGELVRSRTTTSPFGRTVVYTQQYRGVPVFGAMVKANLDQQGDLTSVNGFAAPDLDLPVTPAVSAATAASHAVANVKADPPGTRGRTADLAGVRATASHLVVYRLGSTRGVPGRAVLAWQVSVGNGANVNEAVFVDAATGKLVNRYSAGEAADLGTDRELYEQQIDPAHLIWKDGDAFPAQLTPEQQNLMYDSGNSYWLYANTFDYDSFDGAGAKMVTLANYPDPDGTTCPNAFWDGAEIVMCPGSEADDIVSHEWGHAYTQYTSGLVYQYQSGALNESYSDVWGETIDLINGREDGGEGDITAKRPVGACSTSTRAEVGVRINTPASIAKECSAAAATFGPTIDKTGITGDVVRARDTAEDGGNTKDGCSPYTNAAAVSGHVALAYERPGCDYGVQAKNAQDAGATALIVGSYDENVIPMTTQVQGLSIPAVMIKKSDRARIASKLGAGAVNVTIRDIDTTQRTASTRWLLGEQGKVFGGALRDMWTPTCYGNAGKVSDAEYFCGEEDGGGVHLNSGVPNHAYALLVDGGTYNGVVVPGIGLDKAANLWWLTQLDHLTPTSDFADMADGLDAACVTLTGQPIRQLSVKRVTPGAPAAPITTADCAAVSAMEAAVELRKAPTQCNYKPILAKGSPSVCGKRFTTRTVFKDGFRHGLVKWTRSKVLDTRKARSFPWKGTANAPGSHRGRVVHSADPVDAGSCTRNDTVASSNAITSRAIRLPGGASPRLSFQHYMASENGVDGGNVKISVNGGRFRLVPRAAYAFNKPNSVLFTAEQGNTNPLAGQPAFSGTDGGSATGSWGTSVVNLAKAGVRPGDRVKIRFDMGRDGCGGADDSVDGWFLDNVKVQVCKPKSGAKAGSSLADRRRTTQHR